jgi:hypothetical protein
LEIYPPKKVKMKKGGRLKTGEEIFGPNVGIKFRK